MKTTLRLCVPASDLSSEIFELVSPESVALPAESGSLSRILAMADVHDFVQAIVIANEILALQGTLTFVVTSFEMAKKSGNESVPPSATKDAGTCMLPVRLA